MNNVGSTTLLHPVFNNLEQVVIFRRVLERAHDRKLHVFAHATKDEANTYSEHLIHSYDDVSI